MAYTPSGPRPPLEQAIRALRADNPLLSVTAVAPNHFLGVWHSRSILVLARGHIDHADRRPGAWTHIDFKTAGPAAALHANRAQTAVYPEALTKIAGKELRPALRNVHTGPLVDVDGRL